METLHTVDGRLVPVALPDQPSAWTYDSFYITDIFSSEKNCSRCGRSITYVYVAKHVEYGTVNVGLECIRSVLDDRSIKVAMQEFHSASARISQSRFKNRITKIRSKIPKGILEILQVTTKRGSVLVKQALDHLENKLQLRIFLSSHEIEILQRLEEKV